MLALVFHVFGVKFALESGNKKDVISIAAVIMLNARIIILLRRTSVFPFCVSPLVRYIFFSKDYLLVEWRLIFYSLKPKQALICVLTEVE
jgi:hypothetical protein